MKHIQHKSVVRALARIGLSSEIQNNGCAYHASRGNQEMSWFEQGGSAVCLRVRRRDDHDEMITDYHAGVSCDTIRRAINLLLHWFD